MSETKPKKRGRKPKSNITINNNPIFDSNQKVDNLIVCLKKKKSEGVNLEEDIPGYVKENYELEENAKRVICWNCCHHFEEQNKKEVPINYDVEVFHVYGCFCLYLSLSLSLYICMALGPYVLRVPKDRTINAEENDLPKQ